MKWSTSTAARIRSGEVCGRRNGHPEPYHVKYWEVGNEVGGAEYDASLGLVYRRYAQD